MPGLTPEDERIIDFKLDAVKTEIKTDFYNSQNPYNKKIDEIHQEIMGYAERPGISKRLECHQAQLDDIEKRLKNMEENKTGKIETKKAIFGMIGSGGFVALVAWLSEFFKTKP